MGRVPHARRQCVEELGEGIADIVMIELRDYQTDAIEQGLFKYYDDNDGNPLIILPTGSGKSLVIAAFLKRIFGENPQARVLILTHVQELIQQNYAELIRLWPDAPAGVNCAGLGKRDVHSKIVFGSIQSVHRRAYDLQRVDLVIVDEAHLIPNSADTMYRNFLETVGRINPHMRVVGLTATPFRLGSGYLHEGKNALFSDISYEISVRTLIDRGFLVRPVTMAGGPEIDTSHVGTRNGDFIPAELARAAGDSRLTEQICDTIVEHGQGRRGWLVFGCGVEHSEQIASALRTRGVNCGTPKGERAATIAAFKSQELRALSSMNVLTTGFNAPHVDLIALARPTKSTGLYVQMVGRGLRPLPGKTDCLVLDFGSNIERHGTIDMPKVRTPKKTGGPAPTRTCPDCGTTCPAAAAFCPQCGLIFERSGPELTERHAELTIINPSTPQWLPVSAVGYSKHNKPGKPPSLRVTYTCGDYPYNTTYSEWITLQHDGYARQKAIAWWRRRGPEVPVPESIDEALMMVLHLKDPTEICVEPDGRFFKIVGFKL
jgi:DNA repair protein RadD